MHHHDASCFVHIFPLFRSMRWWADYACLCHQSAFFASLHDCLHFHAWVLLASVSSMLQHNEAMDTRSKPTFFPLKHPLLFTCLLVCPFTHLLTFLLCLPCLSCLFALGLFHILFPSFLPSLVCWFLVFAFACTHTELRHSLPGASKKGEEASM